MKPLGQHFLKNPALIEKIIGALDVRAGETIIEIGPGHGELTIPLAEACQKINTIGDNASINTDQSATNAPSIKIVAIEKDEKLAAALRGKLENLEIDNVEIVSGDALLVLQTIVSNISNTSSAPTASSPSFKIAGNIPYYITGHLLRVISELPTKPERCIFMIQAEVAERIRATPPRMNRLAASVQFWAEPKTIAHVAKTDFSPPPEVDSAIIQLETKKSGAQKADRYYAVVRMLFAQPRKTILNNLRAHRPDGAATDDIIAALSKLGIDPKSRPQDLTIENIIEIGKIFF